MGRLDNFPSAGFFPGLSKFHRPPIQSNEDLQVQHPGSLEAPVAPVKFVPLRPSGMLFQGLAPPRPTRRVTGRGPDRCAGLGHGSEGWAR